MTGSGSALKMINKLFDEKAKNDVVIKSTIKIKLALKGIPVDKLTATTPNDPVLNEKIIAVAKEFGVSL